MSGKQRHPGFTKQERQVIATLLPELRPYVMKTAMGAMVKCPYFYQPLLVIDVKTGKSVEHPAPLLDARNPKDPKPLSFNEAYLHMKALVDKLWTIGKYDQTLMLLQPPERFLWIVRHGLDVPKKRLRRLLASWWIDTEFTTQYGLDMPYLIFKHAGFVTDAPAKAKRLLRGELTVYRAAPPTKRRGMSWTRSLKVARFFHKRNAWWHEAGMWKGTPFAYTRARCRRRRCWHTSPAGTKKR